MLSKYGNCTCLLKIKNKLKIGLFVQIKLGIHLDILWALRTSFVESKGQSGPLSVDSKTQSKCQ